FSTRAAPADASYTGTDTQSPYLLSPPNPPSTPNPNYVPPALRIMCGDSGWSAGAFISDVGTNNGGNYYSGSVTSTGNWSYAYDLLSPNAQSDPNIASTPTIIYMQQRQGSDFTYTFPLGAVNANRQYRVRLHFVDMHDIGLTGNASHIGD